MAWDGEEGRSMARSGRKRLCQLVEQRLDVGGNCELSRADDVSPPRAPSRRRIWELWELYRI